MTRGLSKEQLALIAVYLVALAATLVAVLIGQWRAAAGLGVVAFGLFSGLVILTLAAMTHAAGRARQRINQMHQDLASARLLGTMRQLDDRHSRLTRQISATEQRRDIGEQRLLATFESHRFQLEDDLDQLHRELKAATAQRGQQYHRQGPPEGGEEA